MSKVDYRATPFTTMVVMGESIVAGANATHITKSWVHIVADYLALYQGQPVKLHNKGIGANVISPRSPGYMASRKPSAKERFRDDVIKLQPDLFIMSCGLNDMRAGMPPGEFLADMEHIVRGVREECDTVICLTSMYYMTRYDLYPPFDKGSFSDTELYNGGIRDLACRYNCIFADIWEAEGKADWVIHPDTVHANELGHRLIANRVFEAIATNCSGSALRVQKELEAAQREVENTMERRKQQQNYSAGGDH